MATIETKLIGHKVVSREEWDVARKELLNKEKQLTGWRDQLAADRQALPWVKIDTNYVFDAAEGKLTLADLFDGRSQLMIYHFMFGPDWKEGCPSCSFVSDHLDGAVPHLAARDVTLTMVSRAPLAKIEAFKRRMGWQFKWVSSFGSDFNYDFQVSFKPEEKAKGQGALQLHDAGVSQRRSPRPQRLLQGRRRRDLSHLLDLSGAVSTRWSAHTRLLDLAPKGRDEDHLPFSMQWVRHHDRYGTDIFLDTNKPYWPETALVSSVTASRNSPEAHP